VANFISLVKSGKYANTPFHRVIDGFMAQTGDFQNKDGSGGPGYTIKCECEREDHRSHFAGSLSMAHAGKDTGGSQFFICFGSTPNLDGRHTVFWRVISGLDVLDSLTRTHVSGLGREEKIPGVAPDTIVSAEVVRDRGHEYKPETTADAPAGN
jgi:cyclophilin family peptidyl-prolyl cis-trans isomerase